MYSISSSEDFFLDSPSRPVSKIRRPEHNKKQASESNKKTDSRYKNCLIFLRGGKTIIFS